jgi:polygalacturonase
VKPVSGLSQQVDFYNPRQFGAIGDGLHLDTTALQAALDACGQNGGGTVLLSAGRYLSGAIFFHDNVTLCLEAGAVLLGSPDPADYPVTSNRWEGKEQLTYSPLLAGSELKNITLTGRGAIDGQGAPWWQAFKEKTLPYPRPRLIGFADCCNVVIEGVTLTNSPAWTVNPVRCENVRIHGLTIINPPESPNTDGINPDSCRLVRISDCYVSVGDDCITIKAGTQHELPDRQASCRDIVITNCTLERGHGGVVIGSEMSGGVQNVAISNCIFIGTDRGIRLKSRRGRGGTVEQVRVSNIIMEDVLCPFTMNLYYHCGARGDVVVSDKNARPVDEGTPTFRHIHFSHISAFEVKAAAGFLYGLAEMPLEDISFQDIRVSLSIEDNGEHHPEMADDIPRMSRAGFFIRNARKVRLDHVRISNQVGPEFDIDGSVEAVIEP